TSAMVLKLPLGFAPRQMLLEGRHHFGILNVPDSRLVRVGWLLGPHGNIGPELPQTPVGIALACLLQKPKQLFSRGGHGNLSLTVGYLLTSQPGSESITSTATVCPGSNLATRVARVTPLFRTNS